MRPGRLLAATAGLALSALWGFPASALNIEVLGAPEEITGSIEAAANVIVDPAAIRLRDLLSDNVAIKDFAEKRDAAAIVEFYAARDFQPIWTDAGRATDKARRIAFRLAKSELDGLDPDDYTTGILRLGAGAAATPDEVAAAEFDFSRAVLRYARQAYGGRLDPRSISSMITITPEHPDPVAAMADIAAAEDPVAVLEGFNPGHAGFKALHAKLGELFFDNTARTVIKIPDGKLLKLGVKDHRVALLRQRFALEDGDDPETFDDIVDQAVKDFQSAHNLKPDGIIGRGTYGVLNADSGDRVADVVANMERWRWLPHDLGRRYVWVNIPEFQLRVVTAAGEVTHTTRVVVGTPSNQTPVFSDQMEHIVVNPYWNVPSSIATKEMLPKIQNDPEYFQRRNYEIVQQVGKKTQVIDPASIDWSAVEAGKLPFRFRQPPGSGNALGRIKFMFPNQHAVYLHDTNSRGLFKRDYRAFSHGCVRVDDPLAFADAVFAEQPDWNSDRLKKLFGGREQTIKLDEHLPVHITYFTARVDDGGKLVLLNDLYGHNARVKKALGLSKK